MPDRLPHTIDRTLRIAEALADGPRSFTDLRRILGDPPAPTLARLLRALATASVVHRVEHGYRLGVRLQRCARRIAGSLPPSAILEPLLVRLATITGDSAAFYAWDGAALRLAATHEVSESVHYMPIGGLVPELTQHGFARAVVAQLSPLGIREAWHTCPKKAAPSVRAFQGLLAQARAAGCVVERGEHRPGVARIAVAVRGPARGQILGSLGVSTLDSSTSHLAQVQEAVRAIGAEATQLLHPQPPMTHRNPA